MPDLFFYSSKIIWALVAPDHLLLLLLTLAFVLLLGRYRSTGLRLLAIVLLVAWLIAILPIADAMFHPLESRFIHNPTLPEQVDGIIVLGGSVMPATSSYWQQLETNQYQERIDYFIRLARRYPEAQLVFSGGSAKLQRDQPTEAETLYQYLLQSGLEAERLLMEGQSRNTYENVLLSKRLLQPQSGENWVLITSAFHMPRAVGIFCQQDWPIIPYPVDHMAIGDELYQAGFNFSDHLDSLKQASHEWLGLLAYYLSGKTSQLLPTNCHAAAQSN